MCVKLLAMFLLIFHCSCGTSLFSETLPNILFHHLNPKIDMPKMKQIHKNWGSIRKDEKSYDVAEIDSGKPPELTNQTKFECCVCYESRFVSLKPNCGHEICAVCVSKILAMNSLSDKCAVCRKHLSANPDDYKVNYHKISDLKTEEYDTAAIIAVADDKIEILKFLAEAKANLHRVTLVIAAAWRGHTGIVKFLATQDVDLNQADKYEETPVYVAAREGHIEMVKFLAAQGVDLNRSDEDGATPVWVAASEGHTETVKFLAAQNADLNRSDEHGRTPVYVAASEGHIEIVKFLATQNVDLNRGTDKYGETPVYAAAEQGHTEIIKFLATQNVDLNKADKYGYTPVYIAAGRGQTETVKFLSTQQFNLNQADNCGKTPVYVAAEEGHIETVK